MVLPAQFHLLGHQMTAGGRAHRTSELCLWNTLTTNTSTTSTPVPQSAQVWAEIQKYIKTMTKYNPTTITSTLIKTTTNNSCLFTLLPR